MNYLGIDYGEKRIGLSFGDELGLAMPLPAATDSTKEARFKQIETLIRKRRIGALVVGYPYNMDGSIGFKAKEVDAFIEELETRFALPVHRTDERLTSQHAESLMQSARGNKKKKTAKAQQASRKTGELDSRAATLILQDYLDATLGGLPPIE